MNYPANSSATRLEADLRWALFLDVDGTLLRIAQTPDGAAPCTAVCRALARLRPALDGATALVSGRSIENLDRLFAPLTLPAAGLHGLERRDARGQVHLVGEAEALDHLRPPLRDLAKAHAGLILEDKGRALALHYRQAPEQGAKIRAAVDALTAETPDLRVIHGKMVAEIKPRQADKGSAIEAFMAEAPFRGRVPVFLGDDVTDQDGFRIVNALEGYSVHVGEGPDGAARYRLNDVDAVVRWLTRIATRLEAGDAVRSP